MNIVIISGSPRKVSVTVRVAKYLKEYLKEKHTIELIDLRESGLPPMETVYNTEENTPEEYKALRHTMFSADAFLFVSPEYNGSYAPALKNLLDHFPKSVYDRRAIGIVTASPGAFGGMRAALQMQQMVCALFGVPSPQMLVTPFIDKKFDEEGKLIDESFLRSIDNFTNEYLWLAEALHVCRKRG